MAVTLLGKSVHLDPGKKQNSGFGLPPIAVTINIRKLERFAYWIFEGHWTIFATLFRIAFFTQPKIPQDMHHATSCRYLLSWISNEKLKPHICNVPFQQNAICLQCKGIL